MNRPCDNCPKRKTCTEICDKLEAELPPVIGDDGNAWEEQYIDGKDDTHTGEREAHIESLRYRIDNANLSTSQRIIAEMYFWRGLSHADIAYKFSVTRQSITERISIIEQKMLKRGGKHINLAFNPPSEGIPEENSNFDAHEGLINKNGFEV